MQKGRRSLISNQDREPPPNPPGPSLLSGILTSIVARPLGLPPALNRALARLYNICPHLCDFLCEPNSRGLPRTRPSLAAPGRLSGPPSPPSSCRPPTEIPKTQSESQPDGADRPQRDHSLTPPWLTARAASIPGTVAQDADLTPFPALGLAFGPACRVSLLVLTGLRLFGNTCSTRPVSLGCRLACAPRAQPRLETGVIRATLQLFIGATLSTHGDCSHD